MNMPRQPSCLLEDFSIEKIEHLTLIELENFKTPEFVYLSLDLYAKLRKIAAASIMYKSNYSDIPDTLHGITSINTSAGPLRVTVINHLTNFLHVGSETSFEHIEWIRISREFEDQVLGEGNE